MEMNEVILEIVDNAVAEAVEQAIELGADNFVEELDVTESGGSWRIITVSGKTDFSVPEFPMKESLLKNAKVGKNGKRSKVIPVGKPSKAPAIITSTFQVQQERQRVVAAAKESLQGSAGRDRAGWTGSMVSDYKTRLARNVQQRKDFYSGRRSSIKKQIQEETSFRTITDDTPDESWVRPARELDMTGFLMELNSRIEGSIDMMVTTIAEQYMDQFRSL